MGILQLAKNAISFDSSINFTFNPVSRGPEDSLEVCKSKMNLGSDHDFGSQRIPKNQLIFVNFLNISKDF